MDDKARIVEGSKMGRKAFHLVFVFKSVDANSGV